MAEAATILRGSGTLAPEASRRTLLATAAVPEGTRAIRCTLTFAPARVNNIRNLVTLALFEPGGSARGAAHRHEPTQVVEVGEDRATPGFVAGPLPAGDWTVGIDAHCVMPSDVGGVRYTLAVEASPEPWPVDDATTGGAAGGGQAAADRPPPRSPVDAGMPRWLKGDLHVHSDHSDGRWGIDAIVAYARDAALDFMALTDHNTHTGTDLLRAALHAAGLPTVVIPGLELTTYAGHANALGIEGWADWRTRLPGESLASDGGGLVGEGLAPHVGVAAAPAGDAGSTDGLVIVGDDDSRVPFSLHRPTGTMEAAARHVQARGGLFVVNHPRSPGFPACTGCHWDFDDAPSYADAIEALNGDWGRRQNVEGLALWDRWLAAGWRVPATAGSDAHVAPLHPEHVGYTWAWASADVGSIIGAVRKGRTFMSRGPHLAWESPAPGTEVARAAPELSVRLAGVPSGCQVHLWRDGRLVEFRPVPEGDGVQAFPLRSRPATGTWFRVHLVRQPAMGQAELLALTNPVWVGR